MDTELVALVAPPAKVHQSLPASSVILVVAIVVAATVIGIVLGRLTARRPPAQLLAPAQPQLPPMRPSAPAVSMGGGSDQQIDGLALTCLQLADSVSSPALRGEIENALRVAGYELMDPIGQPFDPALHEAVERRPTADARTHNLIAATFRPGCHGRGHLLRSPEVAVFRFDSGR